MGYALPGVGNAADSFIENYRLRCGWYGAVNGLSVNWEPP